MARLLGIAGVAALLSVPQFLAADDKATAVTALEGRWKLLDVDDSGGIAKSRGFAKHVLIVKGDQM